MRTIKLMCLGGWQQWTVSSNGILMMETESHQEGAAILSAAALLWLAYNLGGIMRCNLVRYIRLLAGRAAMMLPEQVVLQILVQRFLRIPARNRQYTAIFGSP
jgi:hypothetical protein